MSIIAVDVMGGDYGPSITLPACHLFLKKTSDECHLFGDIQKIQPWVATLPKTLQSRVHLFHCPEVIENDTSPKDALRKFRQSSMRLAIEAVKNGQAHAIVSAGNTGALMALSKVILGTFQTIDRPAIAKSLPNLSFDRPDKLSVMLDLGANAECTPKNLYDFSLLGLALHRTLRPEQQERSIKLLNIGSEPTKGNSLVQEAAALLKQHSNIPYSGFIEANQIFAAEADIIVCDGFTGNVSLKTSEGLATSIIKRMKSAFSSSYSAQLGALLLKKELKDKLALLNPSLHNGAFILGLNGIVIKSHGGATQDGFLTALMFASQQAEHQMIEKIANILN